MHGWASDWSPTFVAPDYSIADSYQCDGYRVHVSVVQYLEQHQGKEAVGESNSVIPRAWWNSTTRRRQRVAANLEVNEYRVDRAPMRMTIWNWYAVGAQPTASEFTAKAMEALNALRLRSRSTTSLTVAVEADPHFNAIAVLQTDVPGIWSWFVDEVRPNG
jgi:EpsI family protein